MARKTIIELDKICDEVGVSYLQVVEVMRRIKKRIIEEDAICITKTLGTFYLKRKKATVKQFQGVGYPVPERECVALRGPRFPGRGLRPRVRVKWKNWGSDELATVVEGEINFPDEMLQDMGTFRMQSEDGTWADMTISARSLDKPWRPVNDEAYIDVRLVGTGQGKEGEGYRIEFRESPGGSFLDLLGGSWAHGVRKSYSSDLKSGGYYSWSHYIGKGQQAEDKTELRIEVFA